MTTNLRLLLDESVTDPLAKLVSELSSALNVEYVRDLPIKGADDKTVVEYAKKHNRIVLTTETGMNEVTFPVCTHPGIIVLGGTHRHESIHAGILRKFLHSGERQHAKEAVTKLIEGEARIKTHNDELRIRF